MYIQDIFLDKFGRWRNKKCPLHYTELKRIEITPEIARQLGIEPISDWNLNKEAYRYISYRKQERMLEIFIYRPHDCEECKKLYVWGDYIKESGTYVIKFSFKLPKKAQPIFILDQILINGYPSYSIKIPLDLVSKTGEPFGTNYIKIRPELCFSDTSVVKLSNKKVVIYYKRGSNFLTIKSAVKLKSVHFITKNGNTISIMKLKNHVSKNSNYFTYSMFSPDILFIKDIEMYGTELYIYNDLDIK